MEHKLVNAVSGFGFLTRECKGASLRVLRLRNLGAGGMLDTEERERWGVRRQDLHEHVKVMDHEETV